MRYRHISVAVPVLAEMDNLPSLLEALNRQTFTDFSIYCCVNNPEGWATDSNEVRQAMYRDNQNALQYLKRAAETIPSLQLHIIDHASAGHGWRGKMNGVGWARKELFAAIDLNCSDDELIVSLDADTAFRDTYLESVIRTMNSHPEHNALCIPYYHPLSGNENDDRAMLRYEIYMRHYLISLMESSNPHAFTALGSAMAFPLWSYRRVGGITPLQGGEDFYLMQKFAKTGRIVLHCNESVYPQGRQSARVPFGTGPAISKGIGFMDCTYPLYPNEGFTAVAETYALFPRLFDEDVDTPMSEFLRQQLKTNNPWQPLRKNFKTRELFVHACHERVDGLRILQYLKTFPLRTAEEELALFCKSHGINLPTNFNFRSSPIEEINAVRDHLFILEDKYRNQHTINSV